MFAVVPPPEVTFVMIEKRSDWVMTGIDSFTQAPVDVERGTAPWTFLVQVEGTNLASLTPAPTFSPAEGTGPTPALTFDAGRERWRYRADFSSQELLDSAYANGNYSVTLPGTTVHLDLSDDLYPPVPPMEASAGQWENGVLMVDATQPLTLSTGMFYDISTLGVFGHVGLEVFGPGVNFSQDLASPNDYVGPIGDATALDHTFQPGDLISGATYYVSMEFNTVANVSTELEGALVAAVYSSRLNFEIQTMAAVPEPASWAGLVGVIALGAARVMRRRLQRA